jgi:hypothetical protein
MDQREYERLPGINWSRLKNLRVSPFYFENAPPRSETPALRVGLAVHARILEPGVYESRFALWDGRRAGKDWQQFAEENAHLTILNQQEHDNAKACADAVLANASAYDLLTSGFSEAPQVWTDRETGVQCKGRVDHATTRLVELKTTAIIDPGRFASLAARLGYHCQNAFYLDGLEANGHYCTEPPAMIVVESVPPHDVVVYDVPEMTLDAGRLEYRRLLKLYKDCTERDSWPGLGDERRELILPAWAYNNISDEDLDLTIGGVSMGGF